MDVGSTDKCTRMAERDKVLRLLAGWLGTKMIACILYLSCSLGEGIIISVR